MQRVCDWGKPVGKDTLKRELQQLSHLYRAGYIGTNPAIGAADPKQTLAAVVQTPETAWLGPRLRIRRFQCLDHRVKGGLGLVLAVKQQRMVRPTLDRKIVQP